MSQAVAGELLLDRLIETLMTIAIEHAGADRGLLVLPRGDDLRVEAEAKNGCSRAIQCPELTITPVRSWHACRIGSARREPTVRHTASQAPCKMSTGGAPNACRCTIDVERRAKRAPGASQRAIAESW